MLAVKSYAFPPLGITGGGGGGPSGVPALWQVREHCTSIRAADLGEPEASAVTQQSRNTDTRNPRVGSRAQRPPGAGTALLPWHWPDLAGGCRPQTPRPRWGFSSCFVVAIPRWLDSPAQCPPSVSRAHWQNGGFSREVTPGWASPPSQLWAPALVTSANGRTVGEIWSRG